MVKEHYCSKEGEIAETKQLIRSLSSNEEKVLHNWYDIKTMQERINLQQKQCDNTQRMYNHQHDEMMAQIREINDCQNKLIAEIVKLNTTLSTLKWVLGACAGVITFLITNLIGLI